MRKSLTICLLTTLLLSCSPKSNDSGGNIYTVSIEPQRWLLEQLVEPNADIITMLRSGSDPETYEPSMSQRAGIDRAKVYFTTGALTFEQTIAESSNIRIINTSVGVEPIYGTHSHSHSDHHDSGEHSHEIDPHVWTSISGARCMARNMVEALSNITPDSAEVYAARMAKLESKLDSLDNYIRTKLAPLTQRAFAIWHPSLSYFARDYGLHQIAVGLEGKEMSARQVRHIIDHAKADSVHVFFFQRENDPRQAETVNEAIGSRLVLIDPLDYQWEQQLTLIADELARP